MAGWLNPFNPPEGVDTWQTKQSLMAIGSGGFFGLGFGQSRQKYLYLPEPQNDFIFAVVCEELGLSLIHIFFVIMHKCVRSVISAIGHQAKFYRILLMFS